MVFCKQKIIFDFLLVSVAERSLDRSEIVESLVSLLHQPLLFDLDADAISLALRHQLRQGSFVLANDSTGTNEKR